MTAALAISAPLKSVGSGWVRDFQDRLDQAGLRAATAPSKPPPTILGTTSEEALIAAAKTGSSQAFSVLVSRNQQAVRGFLRRACGDAARADDIAQDTFLAAWSQIRRFDGRSSLRSWLCGIAYRKQLNDRRSTLRGLKRDGDWAEAQGLAVRRDAGAEDRIALETAMKSLPVEQRAAVALCLAADFSHAEAAAALNLPLGTVKSHVSRGRAKLLEQLGGTDV